MNPKEAGHQLKMKRASDVQLKSTPEMIENIHCIVMEDCRMKVRDIAEIVGISIGCIKSYTKN